MDAAEVLENIITFIGVETDQLTYREKADLLTKLITHLETEQGIAEGEAEEAEGSREEDTDGY